MTRNTIKPFSTIILLVVSFNLSTLNAQWSYQIPQTEDTLWVVQNDILDENTVWMGGTNYIWDENLELQFGNYASVYSTIDGGQTWRYKKIEIDTAAAPVLGCIAGINGQEAWAAFYLFNYGSNIIKKTSDGGNTWLPIAENIYTHPYSFIDGILFNGESNGIIYGDPTPESDSTDAYFEIYRTTDGGDNWTRIPSSQIPPSEENEYSYAGEFSSRVGDNIWFATDHGRMFNSSDGGENWESFKVGTGFISNVHFVDDLHGLCAAVDSTISQKGSGEIKYTDDGGKTWQYVKAPYKDSTYFWSLTLIPESYFILSNHAANLQGPPFKTLLTKDKGQTWIEIGSDLELASAKFYNPSTGFAGEGLRYGQDHATKIFKYSGDPLTGLFTDKKIIAELSIDSNPVSQNLSFSLDYGEVLNYKLLINDNNGKLITTKNYPKTSSIFDNVDVTDYQPGIYILTFTCSKGNISKQFIKI